MGILLVLVGGLVLLSLGVSRMRYRGGFRSYELIPLAIFTGVLGFGVGFLVIVRAVRRVRPWAIITAMVMAGCCLAVSLLYLAATVIFVGFRFDRGVELIILIPIAVEILAVTAFIEMLIQLVKAYKHRHEVGDAVRGFTPVMAVVDASHDVPLNP